MKINTNLILVILLILVMLTEPIPLTKVYNSILGRIVVVLLVIYFTTKHTILGLLAVIILISSLQVSQEGFLDSDDFGSSFSLLGNDLLTVEDMVRPKMSCKQQVMLPINNRDPDPITSYKEI